MAKVMVGVWKTFDDTLPPVRIGATTWRVVVERLEVPPLSDALAYQVIALCDGEVREDPRGPHIFSTAAAALADAIVGQAALCEVADEVESGQIDQMFDAHLKALEADAYVRNYMHN